MLASINYIQFQMKIILLIIIILVVTSCTRLDETDLEWMVYEEGDTLVFKSQDSRFDTTYIRSTKIGLVGYNPINGRGGFNTWPEIAQIWYYNPNVEYIYDGKELLYLNKSDPDEPATGFIQYYNEHFFFDHDNFEKLHEPIQIGEIIYSDIIKISSSGYLSSDCRTIKIIWWSKSSGIVKYETCNGIIWTIE
jgi:hypothetical protein